VTPAGRAAGGPSPGALVARPTTDRTTRTRATRTRTARSIRTATTARTTSTARTARTCSTTITPSSTPRHRRPVHEETQCE
jgi:hypothetical protein